MINLEIAQAIAFYLLFFIVFFLGGYSFFYLKRTQDKLHCKEYKLWKCSICTFVYSSVFASKMTVCPRCGSYNKKEEDETA
ncbi:MAG: hypothetical protein ABIG64_02820 [Candidatus Omnitrophota bacterium]